MYPTMVQHRSEDLSGQVSFDTICPHRKESRPAFGVVNRNQLLAQFRPLKKEGRPTFGVVNKNQLLARFRLQGPIHYRIGTSGLVLPVTGSIGQAWAGCAGMLGGRVIRLGRPCN